MLVFDPTKLSLKSLSELKDRQIFLQRHKSGYALAIVIAAGSSEHLICHLDGEHAFHLEVVATRMARQNVLPLPIAVDQLILRIDIHAAPLDLFTHSPGRVLLTPNGEASINVRWIDGRDDDELIVVELPKWQHDFGNRPVFGFERWSLSYLDQDHSWKVLIDRPSPEQVT